MSSIRPDARPLVSAAAATAAVIAAIAAVTLGGSPAQAVSSTVNPFDDAGGFSVYVVGDANLQNSEIEGSLAVGGTLRAARAGSRLPIVHYVAGTAAYAPPIVDGDNTRLLIGGFSAASGIVDVSDKGAPAGLGKGYAKVIKPTLDFRQRGNFVQYGFTSVPDFASSGPVIEGKNHDWATDGVARFTAVGDSVASYVQQGEGLDAVTTCLATPDAADAHDVTVTEDGGKAKLTLEANKVNVVKYSDLFFGGNYASQITYGGSVRPSLSTPVIVRVAAGTTTIKGSTFGNAGEFANFVMWDLSALSGAATLTDKDGGVGRIDGSVYAPDVDLTAFFGPLDGQVIAKTLTTPIGTGELHSYTFKGQIACELDAGNSSTSPSATPSASPSTIPSASPTLDPGTIGSTSPTPAPTATNPTPVDPAGASAHRELAAGAADDARAELSSTGFDDVLLGWLAVGGLVAGFTLVGAARRRRTS